MSHQRKPRPNYRELAEHISASNARHDVWGTAGSVDVIDDAPASEPDWTPPSYEGYPAEFCEQVAELTAEFKRLLYLPPDPGWDWDEDESRNRIRYLNGLMPTVHRVYLWLRLRDVRHRFAIVPVLRRCGYSLSEVSMVLAALERGTVLRCRYDRFLADALPELKPFFDLTRCVAVRSAS